MIEYADVIEISKDAVRYDVFEFFEAQGVDSSGLGQWAREFAACYAESVPSVAAEDAAIAGLEIGFRIALRQLEGRLGL